mmetsp:Transcript_80871/g.261877  ORF Transcript_80871/g.261877 Transcript_80871/m.261877 type:complete len:301 (-) Transcript_80871:75-977(-)
MLEVAAGVAAAAGALGYIVGRWRERKASHADGAPSLVSAQGRKATIAMRDGAEIDARIYHPERTEPAGAIVYAHGGAFSIGDCESNAAVARALCGSTGCIVVDTSYRQGQAHPNPAAIQDLEDVTRHVRSGHPGLRVGVAGSSSGGYFALALSQHPPDGQPYAFCVALNPVAHPGRRREYLERCVGGGAAAAGFALHHGPQRAQAMIEMQTGYWVTDAAADAAGDELGPSEHGTPTMVVLGGQDLNVPPQITMALHRWAHHVLVLGKYGHELCNEVPKHEADSYIPELQRFVRNALKGMW